MPDDHLSDWERSASMQFEKDRGNNTNNNNNNNNSNSNNNNNEIKMENDSKNKVASVQMCDIRFPDNDWRNMSERELKNRFCVNFDDVRRVYLRQQKMQLKEEEEETRRKQEREMEGQRLTQTESETQTETQRRGIGQDRESTVGNIACGIAGMEIYSQQQSTQCQQIRMNGQINQNHCNQSVKKRSFETACCNNKEVIEIDSSNSVECLDNFEMPETKRRKLLNCVQNNNNNNTNHISHNCNDININNNNCNIGFSL